MLLLALACMDPIEPVPSDSSSPEEPAPVLVLAGGGAEGDHGEVEAWSYALYGALLENGDVDGDGLVRVAVLSANEESDWLPAYFEELGADEAFNLWLPDRESASQAQLEAVDAVFLKGGDQGLYYDAWNDTPVDEAVLEVHARAGGVGGTSAGAMSLAGVALAGGRDYISADVLADAHTDYLQDADGGSALKTDFLGLWSGVLVDTHFDERGRLGRLVGAMALADAEMGEAPTGIGLEQRTGVVVRGERVEVLGEGAVLRVQATPDTVWVREAGEPLQATALRLDRLAEGAGWDADGVFGLSEGSLASHASLADEEVLVEGDDATTAEHFELIFGPDGSSREGTGEPLLRGLSGRLDAHDRELRGLNQELLFLVAAELPLGVLVADSTALRCGPGLLLLSEPGSGPALSTLVLGSRLSAAAGPGPHASPSSGLPVEQFVDARLDLIHGDTTYGAR